MESELKPKPIPYSVEAEEAVIGAVLIDPDAYHSVAQVIQPGDFYIHRLRFIWEAITRLQERQIPLDFLTVTDELDQAGKLSEIGGSVYLTGLINQVPTSLHAGAYAQIIKDMATRRNLLQAASHIAKLALQQGTDIEELIQETDRTISSIRQGRFLPGIKSLSEILCTVDENVINHSGQADRSGLQTGFHELDHLVGGLQASDLGIIAGRPGTGKTSLLLSIIKNVAVKQRKRVALFTLEMSGEQLVQRLIAQEIGMDVQHLRSGKFGVDEKPRYVEAIELLHKVPLFVNDTSIVSINLIRSACHKLSLESRLDLIIVDYLQLVSAGERFDNRVQEVSFLTRQLKTLARELEVPVLAAAQLSRAVEQRADKHPLLSDLRESGSIEMDADLVMFIYYPDELRASDHVDIIIAKHRNGPTGIARLVFHRHCARFENPSGQEISQ